MFAILPKADIINLAMVLLEDQADNSDSTKQITS